MLGSRASPPLGPRLRASHEGALLKERQELETCGGGGFFPETERYIELIALLIYRFVGCGIVA